MLTEIKVQKMDVPHLLVESGVYDEPVPVSTLINTHLAPGYLHVVVTPDGQNALQGGLMITDNFIWYRRQTMSCEIRCI